MSDVIKHLNGLLSYELTSIDEYTAHAQFFDDWGFSKLHERIAHEADDERLHANLLIERILFLGGKPDMRTRVEYPLGKSVKEMLETGLQLERDNAKTLKKAIAYCEEQQDYVTRDMLVKILQDTEEDHAYWLRQQLGLMETLGEQIYLQAQL
ncbi:bacterioferritin [Aliidiomarina minuta]|uniref:Bacterioferritin n=1 Tax=Aliidiomarina minuta TaxID=880057 RepID=A0A432W8L7_9GAMM|nr:bacterioferritin [Aliidiomarina minuta]RUO26316.1 bacterioferritin [Aliidiomarina minuta]